MWQIDKQIQFFARLILIGFILLIVLALEACSLMSHFDYFNKAKTPDPKVTQKNIELVKIKKLEASVYGNPHSYKVYGKVYHVLSSSKGFKQIGQALIYNLAFNGEKTASNINYNIFVPSASSRVLPIPSFARVTNLNNNKSIVVIINDRGPFVPGYITKLSQAAATRLGIKLQDKNLIELKSIPPYTEIKGYSKGSKSYFIQLISFNSEDSALKAQKYIRFFINNKPVQITRINHKGKSRYSLDLGPYSSKAEAQKIMISIRKQYPIPAKIITH